LNYSDMNVTELKSTAKARGIQGYSTMKKADLVSALTNADKATKVSSVVDAIKAAYRNMREERSNKGRKAGKGAKVHASKPWQTKDLSYRLQRGSEHATLTGKQSKRLRKTQRKAGAVELTYS
jgi:iron-sulfur cluster repair protein YtfE (RIC family)